MNQLLPNILGNLSEFVLTVYRVNKDKEEKTTVIFIDSIKYCRFGGASQHLPIVLHFTQIYRPRERIVGPKMRV